MTVRCDACGTENRDKAMFCRGCAGKLPAFALAKKPPASESPPIHPAAPRSRGSLPGATDAGSTWSSITSGTLFGGTRTRLAVFALLMIALGASIAWFARGTAGSDRSVSPPSPRDSATASALPPETSLSAGETLVRESSGSPATQRDEPAAPPEVATAPASSAASPAPPVAPADRQTSGAEVVTPGTDSGPAPRNAGRRSGPPPASTRAADPRTGCEHLFFAFAARCEANHCQQSAYARHPRCDAVREQRRRDDARRNSMPVS